MSVADAETLQHQLKYAIDQRSCGWFHVELDKDADILDLSSNVDVIVRVMPDGRPRCFTIITHELIGRMLEEYKRQAPTEDAAKEVHYTTGNPLCIVTTITASSIVEAVSHYLQQESGGLLNT